MTNKTILTTSIVAITMILGFSTLDQQANALSGTINDEISCESAEGIWDGSNGCTFNESLFIGNGEILTVGSDVTFTQMGDTVIVGGILIIEQDAIFNNFGLFRSVGGSAASTINNFGTIENNADIRNIGGGSFGGTINNFGTIENNADINNIGGTVPGIINNFNTINNNGNIGNSGIINNSCNGVITGNSFPFTQETPCDSIPPVITLIGDSTVELLLDDSYVDAGATALDNVDGDITGNIVTAGLPIDTTTSGTYMITYDVSDAAGNAAIQVTRTVTVLTQEESLDRLMDELDDIIASGDIGNEANGLLAKLDQIMAKLDQGNVNSACNQLDAFINQLEGIISNGTQQEIDAVQPVLDLANSIAESYC